MKIILSIFLGFALFFSASSGEARSKRNRVRVKQKRKISSVQNLKSIDYRYSEKWAKKAEKKINRMAFEWKRAKTLGQWMDKAPRRFRLKRRKYFSKFLKQKMPKFIKGRFSLAVLDSRGKKTTTVLSLQPTMSGIRMIIDGVDMTVQKGESVKAWRKRLRKNKKASSSASLINFFIPKAYAGIDRDSMYAWIFHLSGAEDWETREYQPGSYKRDDYDKLVHDAVDLRNIVGLRCEGRTAVFRAPLGSDGAQPTFKVRPQKINTGMIESDVYAGGDRRGSIHVRSDGNNTYAEIPNRSTGQTDFFPGSYMFGAVNAMMSGSPAPRYNNRYAPGAEEAISAISAGKNIRACAALVNAGVDISMCDSVKGSPNDYGGCIKENAINGRLQRFMFNGRNPSLLSGLDPQRALALKAEIASIYSSRQTRVARPAVYGRGDGVSRYINTGGGRFSGSALRESLALGQGSDQYHQEILDCYDATMENKECNVSVIPQSVVNNIRNAVEPIRDSYKAPINSAEQTYQAIEQARANAPAACRELISDESMAAFQDNVTMDKLAVNNTDLNKQLDAITVMGDVGRACCGNAQCRQDMAASGNHQFREDAAGAASHN